MPIVALAKLDLATQRLCRGPGDRQAEAAAGLFTAEDAHERLEDALQVLAGDPRTGVFDDEAGLAAFGEHAHVDRSAARRVADRVVHGVAHEHSSMQGIALDR